MYTVTVTVTVTRAHLRALLYEADCSLFTSTSIVGALRLDQQSEGFNGRCRLAYARAGLEPLGWFTRRRKGAEGPSCRERWR
jgi:hypothetical protein